MTTEPLPRARIMLISLCAMLATVMVALDQTIANVALPHMQGTMGAAQDQISWVLTSYVVSSAIVISMTGFLVERFGRTRLFVASIAGFTVASLLCGAAQTLPQIVLFRLLQGACGAGIIPLSQAVLMDLFPREKQGPALALWGMGVMVGPILGPTLGGYLTDMYNWRWVFLINLPFGILAAVGMAFALPETERKPDHHFDGQGFGYLAVGLGALQLMLDRGQTLDWFESSEIIIEAGVSAISFYLFFVHMMTTKKPFLNPEPFKNANYNIGLLLMFILGAVVLATMALLPTMLQSLMGYPVATAGLLMAPRGLGTMIGMAMVGRLIQKIDARILVFIGFGMTGMSLWEMSEFTLDVSEQTVALTGLLQGFGIGLIFVPLNAACFATLDKRFVTEGAALYNLMRNMGTSIGIAVVVTLLSQNTQINHEVLAEHITAFSRSVQGLAADSAISLSSPAGMAMVNGEINRQATMTSYVNDFMLMMYVTLAAAPMVLLIRKPKDGIATPAPVMHD